MKGAKIDEIELDKKWADYSVLPTKPTYTIHCVCANCGHAQKVEIPKGEWLPIDLSTKVRCCPVVYLKYPCSKCGCAALRR